MWLEGTDPDHPDNKRLRLAFQRGAPLVYFHGIVPGKYLAAWPVHPDILDQQDGPTLVHGFQALHGKELVLPGVQKLRPDRLLLAKRYEQFKSAI